MACTASAGSITVGLSGSVRENDNSCRVRFSPRVAAISMAARARVSLRFLQAAFQALRVAAHDHQQIVEVVRDAAGKLPDGVHLLQMRGLALRAFERGGGFLFGGDVTAGDVDQTIALGHRPLQPAP